MATVVPKSPSWIYARPILTMGASLSGRARSQTNVGAGVNFSEFLPSADSTLSFLICSSRGMTDRPASWRFPTRQQIERLGFSPASVGESPPTPAVGPADDLPSEYWQALLDAAAADSVRPAPFPPERARRLDPISGHLLRVGCRRCGRTVEIQKVDAVRLYGPSALWKDVGQRLLDHTCTQRTGSHEDDGCWPSYD